MVFQWTVLAVAAIIGGVASHRLIFIHGELDNNAVTIAKTFIYLWLLITVVITLQLQSILVGLFLGSVLLLLAQLGLAASIVIYRLFQHPLRRFPGATPFVLTQWRAVYEQSLDERYFVTLRDQHAAFGDFVRAGPNYLSVNRLDALHSVYAPYSLCKRGPWHDLGALKYILQRTRDRQAHDQEKIFWQHAFDPNALDNHVDKINQQVLRLLHRLPKDETVTNLTDEMKFYGFNVMSATTISRIFDESESGEVMRVMDLLESGQRLLGIFGYVPYSWSLLEYIPRFLNPVPEFYNITKQLLDTRLQERPGVPDIISYLLEAQNDPSAPGFPLFGEFRLALTTGSLLNSYVPLVILYFLSKNLSSLRKLQDEVSPLVTSGRFDMRKEYPVLDATIKESLRLMPPFPNGGQMKTPTLGLQIGGTWIPGEVIIKVPLYTIMRDERYFEDPDSFVPERWTTHSGMVRDAEAYKPFLLGAYSCVAKEYAIMQTRAVIAAIVTEYDLAFSGPEGFEKSGKDRYIMVYGPLRVHLTPRKKTKRDWTISTGGWKWKW